MKSRLLKPLFYCMLFDVASFTVFFPILTLVFFDSTSRLFNPHASMSLRSMEYGTVFSCYWIGSLIAAPILSWLSDYLGRRKILLVCTFGTFLLAVNLVLGILSGKLIFILAGALIGGLCARTDPIAQASVGDISSDQKVLYMSYLQLFISIGAFVGPSIGGFFAERYWFQELNFSLPFIIAAILAILAFATVWFYFKETATVSPARPQEIFFSFKEIIVSGSFLKISFLLVLIQWSWSTYYQFIAPILKHEFHFSATLIGFFIGVIALWLAFASGIVMPKLQRYFNLYEIIYLAAIAVFIGIAATLMTFLWHPWILKNFVWLFAGLIAGGDVVAYCAITSLYSDSVSTHAQGQVMGASFVIISAVWGCTAFIGGFLLGKMILMPLVLAMLTAFALVVYLKWYYEIPNKLLIGIPKALG